MPTCVPDVQSFLGLAGYYRRFIKNFAQIALPLTELTKSDAQWRWTEVEQQAFDHLKRAMTTAPVLLIPDMTKPFEIVTDASGYAVGATLLQDQGRGMQPIAFESRKLTPAERNYTTGEQELLAVIHALRTWRHYVEGHDFKVVSDHLNLKYLQEQPHLSKRQMRWVIFLSEFGLGDIGYRKGELNQSDPLSRRPDYQVALTAVKPTLDQEFLTKVEEGYSKDPKYADAKFTRGLEKRGELWYRGDRLAIPAVDELRVAIMHEAHDAITSGHRGEEKTTQKIARRFWWPHLRRSVKFHINRCAACQRSKPNNQRPMGLLQPLPVPQTVWEEVSLDLVTGLPVTARGHDAIVVFVDRLSKMVHFVPICKTITAEQLARVFVDHVYRLHGMPKSFVSDRDPRFTSHLWRTMMSMLGTKLKLSTAAHPQSDGSTERANRTMQEMLRAYAHPRGDEWDTHLPLLEFAYNDSVHKATGYTPFYLNLGHHPRSPLDLVVAPTTPEEPDDGDDDEIGTRAKAAKPVEPVEPGESTLTAATTRQASGRTKKKVPVRGEVPTPSKSRDATKPRLRRRTTTHEDGSRLVIKLRDLIEDARSHMEIYNSDMTRQENRHRRPVDLKVGDKVLLSTEKLTLKEWPEGKLRPKFIGPFEVLRLPSPNVCQLKLPKSWRIHSRINVDRLRKVHPDCPPTIMPTTASDMFSSNCYGDHAFDFCSFYGHYRRARRMWYRARWAFKHPHATKLYPMLPPCFDTWMSDQEAERDCLDALKAYRALFAEQLKLPQWNNVIPPEDVELDAFHPDRGAPHNVPTAVPDWTKKSDLKKQPAAYGSHFQPAQVPAAAANAAEQAEPADSVGALISVDLGSEILMSRRGPIVS
jgi:hypothetical protein